MRVIQKNVLQFPEKNDKKKQTRFSFVKNYVLFQLLMQVIYNLNVLKNK